MWRDLSETIHRVEDDPSFLLSLSIQAPEGDTEEVLHNLPSPDFDDTGFIGREQELDTISRAIKGPYPVITVTGEGGLGKTALALKACYDLIDSDECNFDAVIWTSAKTTRLTPTEIETISSAVNSSIGVFDTATEALGLDQSGEPISRLLKQLADFRVLLIIDNLETVLDDNVRRVVKEVPTGSKILFTSRVSIGAFDYPIPLEPLGEAEAITYFRACSRYFGLTGFAKQPNDKIKQTLKKLYNNPLFIKWFLQCVAKGQSPNRILANPKIILEFCLSNVIENLSSDAVEVLETMIFISEPRPITILCLLTELQPIQVERAVNELVASNLADIIDYADTNSDQKFQATNLAKFYVRNYVSEPKVDQAKIVRRKKELAITREQLLKVNTQNEFDMDQIRLRGEEDVPAANLLKQAISFIKAKDYKAAQERAEQAIELSPNYFETHRVLAGACAVSGSLMRAQEEYESAISLFPDYAPLRLWYGNFLMRQMDDLVGAREQYNRANTSQPDEPQVRAAIARLEQFEGNIDESRELLRTLMSEEGLAPRLRRRVTALFLESYSREVERLTQIDDMSGALKELLELKDEFVRVPSADIDNQARKKVLFAKPAVVRLDDFFTGTENQPFSNNLSEWFLAEFGRGRRTSSLNDVAPANDGVASGSVEPLEDLTHGKQYNGIILKLHQGFGFITVNQRSVFFPFTEWRSQRDLEESLIGEKVTFTVGENHKGICAQNVQVLAPAKPDFRSISRAESLHGTVETCKSGYAFVLGDDGATYFLAGAELQDNSVSIANLKGSRIRFDATQNASGRYPRAENAAIVI